MSCTFLRPSSPIPYYLTWPYVHIWPYSYACMHAPTLNLWTSVNLLSTSISPLRVVFLTLDRFGDRPNRYLCTLAHFSYVFIRMINTHHSQRNLPFPHGSSPTTSDSCVTSGRHTSQKNTNRALAPSICRHSIAVEFSARDNVFQSRLLRQQRSTLRNEELRALDQLHQHMHW